VSASEPTVRELLAFHYECLQGMYFSEFHKTENGALLFSNSIKDPYYNFFAPEHPVSSTIPPPAVLKEFSKRDRQPAVYLTPLAAQADATSPPAVDAWARDAWLVGEAASLTGSGPAVAGLRTFVVDAAQREQYVATFAAAYSGDDPSDPYGQLDPAYTESLNASFDFQPPGYNKYYLVATQDDVPVGVAALFTANMLAGVYGVGTVPLRRRCGVGEAMMAQLACIAADDGASHILLQTEAGSGVQRWYEKLGYKHRFTAPYVQVAPEQDI